MPSRPRSPPTCARPPAGDPPDGAQGQPVTRRGVLSGVLAAPLAPAAGVAPSGAASSTADTELLRRCALVHALNAAEVAGGDERWSHALLRISELRPTTVVGLHAKVRLALSLMPFVLGQPCPAWVSPDERLTWSLLCDVLALSDDEKP